MTKLILAFAVGVVIGVLGATSSIFQGDPAQPPEEVVTSEPAMRAAEPPRERTDENTTARSDEVAETAAPVEQPASEPEPEASNEEATATAPEAEQDLAQSEPEPPVSDDEDQATIFCMQMESSGECRCYETDTMVIADVSAEECMAQLEEE